MGVVETIRHPSITLFEHSTILLPNGDLYAFSDPTVRQGKFLTAFKLEGATRANKEVVPKKVDLATLFTEKQHYSLAYHKKLQQIYIIGGRCTFGSS